MKVKLLKKIRKQYKIYSFYGYEGFKLISPNHFPTYHENIIAAKEQIIKHIREDYPKFGYYNKYKKHYERIKI